MNYIITEFSKYIMVLAIFSYVIESIWPLFFKRGDNTVGVYIRQYIYMGLVHTLSMISLYITTQNPKFITLFLLQCVSIFAVNRLTILIYERASRILLNHMCFLLIIGYVELSRLNYDKAVRQFFIICVSLVIFLIIPYAIKKFQVIKNYTVLIGTIGALLLVLVFSLGETTYGSKLSYQILGFSFQPSEFVKILFVFFVAGMLYNNCKFYKVGLTAVFAALFVLLLVLSKDLGSALIYYLAFIAMIFVASGRIWYSLAGLGVGSVAAYMGYNLFSHVQTRIAVWLDPWSDINATGYQLTQSLFAIGTGGWMGMGLGKGQPTTIPLVEEDYMFSAICEEYGVLFGIGIILLYLSLFVLLLKITLRTKDMYYRIVLVGLSTIVCVQTFLTIGGSTRLIPLTGVTLPLISNGGSSAMSTIIIFAVCIGVSILPSKSPNKKSLPKASNALVLDDDELELLANEYEDEEEFYEEETDEYFEEEEYDILQSSRPIPAYQGKGVTGAKAISKSRRVEIVDREAQAKKKAREEKLLELQKAKALEEEAEEKLIRKRKRNAYLLTACSILMYVALIVNIIKYMNLDSFEAISNDYNIVRQEIMAEQTIRGSILAADGTVLAETIIDEYGNEVRYYPFGDTYAHAVGYSTYGKTGIENSMNIYLINSNVSFATRTANGVNDVKNPGDNVITTLIPELQDIARSSLGVYSGAIIVTKADTGEILAMVSTPSFDPNTISMNFAEISEETDDSPLINRVSQGRYQPGSTFKVITLLEYMRENPTTYRNYTYTCSGAINVGNTVIHCFRNNVHGYQDLYASLGNSCNSSFANIALTLDRLSFADTLNTLLFNTDLPVSFPANQSSASCREYMDSDELAQTAIGQGKVLMTPLHLNMITQAIANGGVMMTPYIVSEVVSAEGDTVKTFSPTEIGAVMTPEEAAALMTYLEYDVTNGTARKLGGQSYSAAGKTGSAEFREDSNISHAWFTGYAPADNPEIVITIILEGGGTGGDYCVPIARRIFTKYFSMTEEQ